MIVASEAIAAVRIEGPLRPRRAATTAVVTTKTMPVMVHGKLFMTPP